MATLTRIDRVNKALPHSRNEESRPNNASSGDEVTFTQAIRKDHRPTLYITLAIIEFFLGGGFFALLPLFFAIVYKVKSQDNPETGVRWITILLLIAVFLYGTICNLYTLATVFIAVQ